MCGLHVWVTYCAQLHLCNAVTRANGDPYDHNWLIVDSHGPKQPKHFLTQDGKEIKLVLDGDAWKPENVIVASKWQEILASGRYMYQGKDRGA